MTKDVLKDMKISLMLMRSAMHRGSTCLPNGTTEYKIIPPHKYPEYIRIAKPDYFKRKCVFCKNDIYCTLSASHGKNLNLCKSHLDAFRSVPHTKRLTRRYNQVIYVCKTKSKDFEILAIRKLDRRSK